MSLADKWIQILIITCKNPRTHWLIGMFHIDDDILYVCIRYPRFFHSTCSGIFADLFNQFYMNTNLSINHNEVEILHEWFTSDICSTVNTLQ